MTLRRADGGERLPRRLRCLYPLLFAVFPVLSIAASNAGDYRLGDALTIAAVFATATLLGLVVLLLALRRTHPAAFATMVGVALFYGYPLVYDTVEPAGALVSDRLLPLVAIAAAAGMVGVVVRRGVRLESFTTFMALTGAVLVGWSSLRLAANEWRGARAARASGLVRAFARPVPLRSDAAVRKPDIYLIVLDAYANADVLRRHFAFDNSVFEDSLRAHGFVIPRSVRSNYAHTFLSLASILNMAQVTPLAGELGERSTDRWLPGHLIEHNRAARFLRSQGYRFVFFPSGWSALTMRNRNADEQFEALPGFALHRELDRTDLRRQLVDNTMLRIVRRLDLRARPRSDPDHIINSFAALHRFASREHPTFVFAHLMIPHLPYVLDEDCAPVPGAPGASLRRGTPADRQLYLGQLRCANRLVLAAVPRLLAASGAPPVILLQADHGSVTLWPWDHPSEPPTPAEAEERLGAFGAYLLPHGGAASLPDSISAVNVLRHVFSYYLGADLPPLPDSAFFSYLQLPYHFFPVDADFRIGKPSASARSTRSN